MWTARAAVLLTALIVGPVTVFAMVPTVFGLERYVMTGDVLADSVPRGSVMFDRVVPASDVAEGDVVTYLPPASSGLDSYITRRVVDVGEGYLQTQAHGAAPDEWSVAQSDYPAISRMVFSVPYLGYLFLWAEGTTVWEVMLIAAGGVLLIVFAKDLWVSRRRSQGQSEVVRV